MKSRFNVTTLMNNSIFSKKFNANMYIAIVVIIISHLRIALHSDYNKPVAIKVHRRIFANKWSRNLNFG